MNKFEKTDLTKIRIFPKNTWYDWYDCLIKYIPEPIKKPSVGLKTKLWVFLKASNIANYNVKTVYGGGKKQSEENIIQNIRNLFKLKKKMK